MQCNQPFYGNSFTNGPFGSPFNTPLQPTQGMYPEIVGEGHVTTLTLPDGSVQFFFMPTIKWWSPNASQCQPFQTIPNPMFQTLPNTNNSIPPPCNNNIGTWFIRSVSNPFPQNAFSPPNQRIELPRLAINADYNRHLNYHDAEYQVKFHNDDGTSTTDLVYFYPSLRKRDFVFMPPCKDQTVQIDTVTNNTVCHYQVVCSKPCNCLVGATPMSLETLVIPDLTPQSNQPCNYSTGAKPIRESPPDPNLSPKRIKTCNCVWSKPLPLESPVDPNLTSKSIKCDCSICAKHISLESPVDPNLTSKSIKTCDCSVCAKAVNLESAADPSPKRIKTCNCVCSKSLSFESPVDPNLTSKSNKTCDCSVCVKPVSLVPPVDLTSKSIKTCDCSVSAKPMSLKAPVRPNLTPKSKTDEPMSVECQADENLTSKTKKLSNYSVDTDKPMSLESLADLNQTAKTTNTSANDSSYKKEQNKRGQDAKKSKMICGCCPEEKKKKRRKSMNIFCTCDRDRDLTLNIESVDKSITTYADESVGSNPVDGRETQTSRTEDMTSQCDVDTKPVQNKAPLKTKWIDKDYCSDCCSTCDERSGDDTKNRKYTQRNRGSKFKQYKRSKSNKCECGCCDCESSMDCCTASEVETVISKDNGRETPFTCCTNSNTTFILEHTRESPINIGKRTSIGKENSSFQWLRSDNISEKGEVNDKEMSEPPVSPALDPSVSPATVMDGESPEKLLNPCTECAECEPAPSTCGDECCKQ